MKSINLIWLFALILTISTSCKNSDSENKKDRTEKVRGPSKDKKDRGQRKNGPAQKATAEQLSERLSTIFELTEEQVVKVNDIIQAGNFDDLSMEDQKSFMGEIRKQITTDILTAEQVESIKAKRSKAKRKAGERRSPKGNKSAFERIDNMVEFSSDQQIQVKALVEESGVDKMSGEEQKAAFNELKERVMNEVLTEEQKAQISSKQPKQQ